jgi:hypothetical protein
MKRRATILIALAMVCLLTFGVSAATIVSMNFNSDPQAGLYIDVPDDTEYVYNFWGKAQIEGGKWVLDDPFYVTDPTWAYGDWATDMITAKSIHFNYGTVYHVKFDWTLPKGMPAGGILATGFRVWNDGTYTTLGWYNIADFTSAAANGTSGTFEMDIPLDNTGYAGTKTVEQLTALYNDGQNFFGILSKGLPALTIDNLSITTASSGPSPTPGGNPQTGDPVAMAIALPALVASAGAFLLLRRK